MSGHRAFEDYVCLCGHTHVKCVAHSKCSVNICSCFSDVELPSSVAQDRSGQSSVYIRSRWELGGQGTPGQPPGVPCGWPLLGTQAEASPPISTLCTLTACSLHWRKLKAELDFQRNQGECHGA